MGSRISLAHLQKPLRVLMISAAGELGGAERSFYEMVCALPALKIEAHVCAPPQSALARLFKDAQIPVEEVTLHRVRRTAQPLALAGELRALHRSARAVSALCAGQRFDLLHANTDVAAFIAWEVSRLTRLPFVWHCRDLRPLHGLARLLASRAAAVIAISSAVEEHLKREGVKPEKIHLILNGIDLSRFTPPPASRNKQPDPALGPPGRPVLLSVGALVPWKKHELFLETLERVRRSVPDVLGLLAGSDLFAQNSDYVRFLKERARELKLGDASLKMLGQHDDIPSLLASVHTVVSCSENEPFGRILAEAGAAGVPVVATNSGAKAEIVAEGVSGFLTAQADVTGLALACVKLLKDDLLRKKMGQAARLRVQKLFDVRRTAQEAAALFLASVNDRK